jgi:GH24 family phage-related lysozyme (muramidase)
MAPSDRAVALILEYEVGSSYRASATWPGGASGITVGIGYDLGYASEEDIQRDWGDLVSVAMLGQMLRCSGSKGAAAQALLPQMKIGIPESSADTVFHERDIPRYSALTATTFPNCAALSGDSFGALVSLVFNRGASLIDSPPGSGNRAEMREIYRAMDDEAFATVPGFIRAMKRLWIGKGLDGLLARRDAEADLFEAGLVAAADPPPAPIDEADALDTEFNPGA